MSKVSKVSSVANQANPKPIYIRIPQSRIIILKLGNECRCLYLDVQPTAKNERQDRLVEAQKLASVVRQVNPKPKRVVTVIIGPTEVQCDLDLLKRNSAFFSNGKHGMAYGLPSSDVTLLAFMIIYKWMAKPNEIILPPMLMSVFKAARYLKIQVLVDQFMVEFRDPYTAREEIGFHMYFGLQKLNLCVPYRKMMRVHKFFLTLIGSPEFLNIWPNALTALLDSSSICVNSEMEVLIAIIRWLYHDYTTRRPHLDKLMRCVRFDCIPLEALLHMRAQKKINNGLGCLLFRPEIEIFLKRAPPHNNHVRYCNRRIWVYDKLCDYHHDTHCPKRNFITFDQFHHFQEKLRTAPELHWWHRQQLNPYVHNCRHEQCRRKSGPSGLR